MYTIPFTVICTCTNIQCFSACLLIVIYNILGSVSCIVMLYNVYMLGAGRCGSYTELSGVPPTQLDSPLE